MNNFHKVRLWHLEGVTISGDNVDEDDIEESTRVRITKARAVYEDSISSIFALACIIDLFGEIPSMVAQCSAEFDHLHLEVIDRLDDLKSTLLISQSKAGAERSFI